MSVVNCRIDKEQVTVGDHLLLNCTGDSPPGFSLEKSEFKLNEANKYTVKLLKAEHADSGAFNLDFTVYAPGEYKINELILTDGINEISLNGATIKVESVLKPSEDGKPPEPFGALMPIGIITPVYYYLLLLFFVLVTGLYGAYRMKRHLYYKKLKEKLKQYDSPITVDAQFYKSVRLAEKGNYPLDQIEKAFRLYNLRAYQLPMFELSNERVLKYFRRNFPKHKNTRHSLHKLIGEFDELQKRENLTFEEKNEFIKKLYRYVDTNKGLD